MAPIYESDVAEERWTKAEWSHYELWERIELRIRRHKRLWIFATLIVFLALSAIPTLIEQSPKWTCLSATRRLAQEITRIKREAAIEHAPYRLHFLPSSDSPENSVIYQVERVDQCDSSSGTLIRTGSIVSTTQTNSFRLISPQTGLNLAIPGLLQDFCYDPLGGSSSFSHGEVNSGFAVIPVKDLAARRIDRLSILLLTGPTAEATFE